MNSATPRVIKWMDGWTFYFRHKPTQHTLKENKRTWCHHVDWHASARWTTNVSHFSRKVHSPCCDLDLWPLILKHLSAMPSYVVNICGKFHWNPSTKYRDIASCKTGVTRRMAGWTIRKHAPPSSTVNDNITRSLENKVECTERH